MVYAARGIGKTHFSLGVAYAVSSGGSFLQWQAPQPRGVLFLDGEMPGAVLQERIARIAASNDLEPSAPFRIVTPDLQTKGMIDLGNPADQREIAPFLDGIDLIIADNLSTLAGEGVRMRGRHGYPFKRGPCNNERRGVRSCSFTMQGSLERNGEAAAGRMCLIP